MDSFARFFRIMTTSVGVIRLTSLLSIAASTIPGRTPCCSIGPGLPSTCTKPTTTSEQLFGPGSTFVASEPGATCTLIICPPSVFLEELLPALPIFSPGSAAFMNSSKLIWPSPSASIFFRNAANCLLVMLRPCWRSSSRSSCGSSVPLPSLSALANSSALLCAATRFTRTRSRARLARKAFWILSVARNVGSSAATRKSSGSVYCVSPVSQL